MSTSCDCLNPHICLNPHTSVVALWNTRLASGLDFHNLPRNTCIQALGWGCKSWLLRGGGTGQEAHRVKIAGTLLWYWTAAALHCNQRYRVFIEQPHSRHALASMFKENTRGIIQ